MLLTPQNEMSGQKKLIYIVEHEKYAGGNINCRFGSPAKLASPPYHEAMELGFTEGDF